MIPPAASVQVFDANLNFLGEIDTYSSLTHTRGWNGPGEWALAINWNIYDDANLLQYAALFEIGGFITIDNDSHKCGIINSIVKPIDESGKQGQVITVSGAEPGVIFNRRLLNPPAGSDLYVLSAPAETVIKTIISNQCGPTSLNANRIFSMLTIAPNLARGSSYLVSNAYTTLLEELSTCSVATTCGWFIYIDRANKKLVLDCALGNNLVAGQPANAIFSTNYDTLKSAELATTIDQYKNLVTVVGKGDGADRPVMDVFTGTEPADIDRYECFVNANDVISTPDLTLKGQAQLGTYKYTSTLEGAALAKSPLIYGTDYDLGDYVTIQSYDYSENKQITSITESWSNLSYEISPMFDKAPATITSQMAKSTANLGAQISKISTATPTVIDSTVYAAQVYAGITIPAGYNVPVSGTIGLQRYQLWPDGVMHLYGSTGDIGPAGQDIGGGGATFPGRWFARAIMTYAITFFSVNTISTGYVSQGWVSTAYGGDPQTNSTLTLISWFNNQQTAGWSATFETWGRWKA